jgi:hypothetical protein
MTLSGVIQSVTARADNALMVALDDGLVIRFDRALASPDQLIPGTAITVVVGIDDNNELIALSLLNGKAELPNLLPSN